MAVLFNYPADLTPNIDSHKEKFNPNWDLMAILPCIIQEYIFKFILTDFHQRA